MNDPLSEHRSALWALCYRLTGSAADADDLVQETFQRALERPPKDQTLPWRPWLVRVATHLSIDHLRHRQRTPYVGPWLPSPVDLDTLDAEARLGAAESLSYSFLIALEALDPVQRAVFILRDVLGWTGPEVAECLELSPGNVRVILHRARQAIPPSAPPKDASRYEAALGQFAAALATGDLANVEALLTEQARTVQDSAGEFKAALRVVTGRNNVARFFLGVSRFYPDGARSIEPRILNGTPALIVEMNTDNPIRSRKYVLRLELDDQDRITDVQMILATPKLTHI